LIRQSSDAYVIAFASSELGFRYVQKRMRSIYLCPSVSSAFAPKSAGSINEKKRNLQAH
jgi:hypothetical protein